MSYNKSWGFFLTGIVSMLACQTLPAQAPSTSGTPGGTTSTTGGGGGGGGGSPGGAGSSGNLGGTTAISGTSFNNLSPSPTSSMAPSMAIGGTSTTSGRTTTGTGTTSNTPVPTSYNPWMPYYLNAYQPGLGSSLTGTQGRNANTSGGAFGQPLFSVVTTTPTGTTTASTASTQSQATGFTTLGMNKAPVYVTTLSPDFPKVSFSQSKLQKELLATLQRSSALRGQGQIEVTVTQNAQVVLKGAVSRDQLRRLAEGLVRMTPGVGNVQNDLQVTAAQKK